MVAKLLLIAGMFGLFWVWLQRRENTDAGPADKMVTGPGQGLKQHWLLGISGHNAGKTFHIGLRTVTMGRGSSNFVQVDDTRASRVQCQLLGGADGAMVRDMDSANGTFVNGEQIKEVMLKDGDELMVGSSTFLYRTQGDFPADLALAKKNISEMSFRSTVTSSETAFHQAVRDMVEQCGGDKQRAAEQLGLPLAVVERFLR
jgi:hypothetical protein